MSELEMSDAEIFREWYSARMGHDIGVRLGIKAAKELTEENSKLVDTITEQEKVISELEALVESAFREGYSLGYSDGNSDGQSYCGNPCRDDDEQWKLSDAIEELAKHKQSKGE